MRSSQRLVSLRTHTLAFAVVLSPAFMQTSEFTCATGNTNLSLLEFEVDGQNQIIGFTPNQTLYNVSTDSETAIVRAQSVDPAAALSYQLWRGTAFLEGAQMGVGIGEVTLNLPVGQSALRIYVRPPGGAYAYYSVNVGGRSELPCTEQGIRDAIAAGGGPYTFDCNGPTTVVTAAELVIDNDVILDGEGKLTVAGNDDHGVFAVDSAVTAELHGFVVTNGRALRLTPSGHYLGGGIRNNGTLLVTDSIVVGNYAQTHGGGIYNAGDLTMTDSTVSTNSGGFGAGIYNAGTLDMTGSTLSGNNYDDTPYGYGGIGIGNYGTLTMTKSAVIQNSASDSLSVGGGISNGGNLTMTSSTVSGNTGPVGGGINNEGTLIMTNSTVSGNTAASGGGIFNGLPGRPTGTAMMTMTNSTVSGNTASYGGGIAGNNWGVLAATSSLIDGDCVGSNGQLVVTSNGYNIESPANTCGLNRATDQFDVTAAELNLGPLADNGGPTQTHALSPGSIAVDLIPVSSCVDADSAPLTEDQRGAMRPSGSMCDVGAFELEVAP